jgi:hypothetical protein
MIPLIITHEKKEVDEEFLRKTISRMRRRIRDEGNLHYIFQGEARHKERRKKKQKHVK